MSNHFVVYPFQPIVKKSKKLSAGVASSSVQVTPARMYTITNDGSVVAYFATGEADVAAEVDIDMCILAGETMTLKKPVDHDYIAGITESGDTILRIAPGNGN